jgi:hypothetical protein
MVIKGETIELRAKLNALTEIVSKWSDKINAYHEALKRVDESK